ncbi:MAG: hypothetical protein ACI8TP_001678 [Acidimicrobiales bacterium]|jgi:hypothetical protein
MQIKHDIKYMLNNPIGAAPYEEEHGPSLISAGRSDPIHVI